MKKRILLLCVDDWIDNMFLLDNLGMSSVRCIESV